MDALDYLGAKVTVAVDRRLGSLHPKHGYTYPVNYGFIAGTTSGDGEELDAYILGVEDPVDEFAGECIGVIRRNSEADDKLIVVPIGIRLSAEDIRSQTCFQEQFFESELFLIRNEK